MNSRIRNFLNHHIVYKKCTPDQLYNLLVLLIKSGAAKANDAIVSSRDLARMAGLGENAILQVFERLKKDKLIYSIHGKGTFVSPESHGFSRPYNPFGMVMLPVLPPLPVPQDSFQQLGIAAPNAGWLYRHHYKKYIKKAYVNVDLQKSSEIMSLYLPASLQGGLLDHLNFRDGLNLQKTNYTLRYGRFSLLRQLAQLLLGPSDTVVNTEGGNVEIDAALGSTGATILQYSTAHEDRFISGLEQLINERAIKAIFCNSRCSYTSTHTLSAQARQELVVLARKSGIWLLEEDTDHEFWYPDENFKPLLAQAHDGLLIHLAPVSRMDVHFFNIWQVAGPASLISRLQELPMDLSGQADLTKEQAMHDLVLNNELNEARDYALEKARINLEAVECLFQNYLLQRVDYCLPKAGLNVAFQLRPGTAAEAFCAKFSYLPIRPSGIPRTHFHLGFGSLDVKELESQFKKIKEDIPNL